jgi:hypothetical protein
MGSIERPDSAEASRPTSFKRKTQRELLEERLAKMNKMAQQRADDLKAIVDDADATALEITQMDEAALSPTRTEAPVVSRQTEPPREAPILARSDRPFRRVVSERDASTSATTSTERIPGAPVRFTPSPTMRAAKLVEQPKQSKSNAVEMQKKQQPVVDVRMASPMPQPPPVAPPVPPQKERVDAPPPVRDPSPQPPAMPPPPQVRRRPGIGRKEIRKSAQACFPTALNVAANGTSTVMLAKPFQAPKPPAKPKAAVPSEDTGPWTREAFDLFNWRPPGWDEEKWCVSKDDGGAAA